MKSYQHAQSAIDRRHNKLVPRVEHGSQRNDTKAGAHWQLEGNIVFWVTYAVHHLLRAVFVIRGAAADEAHRISNAQVARIGVSRFVPRNCIRIEECCKRGQNRHEYL